MFSKNRARVTCVLLGAITALQCCPTPVPSVILVPVPRPACSPPSVGIGHAPEVALDSFPAGHVDALRDVIDRAGTVILSTRFHDALGSVTNLTDSPGGTGVFGETVFQQIAGLSSARAAKVRYFEGNATCRYHGHGETARTQVDSTTAAASDHSVSTCIEPLFLNRLGDGAELGCGINTIVHEWSHAILREDGWMLYLDGGHGAAKKPLVSYTLGAIAQCVYLEQAVLKTQLSDKELAACVEQIGTNAFDPDTCDDGWPKKLIVSRTSATGGGQAAGGSASGGAGSDNCVAGG